jgi:DNA-binding transcriptional MocR family regulator
MNLQTLQTLIPPGFIDLGVGNPQPELLPLRLLRDAARDRLSGNEGEFLQYGAEQGDGYFRDALAKFLTPRYGFPVSHDELFITAGISSALDLLCTLFTRPGDAIFVEEPTYFLALRIFADHDLRVASIRTDETGLDFDDLIHALKEHRPKFFYIVPTFQNPGGHSLPEEQRRQLVSLAQKHGFLILADEVYQFLAYAQAPPQSFGAFINSEQVIVLNSFSKVLAPGLRLGWMQTHPSIMRKINACGLLDSGGGMNPFTSAIVQRIVENGGLEGNIANLVNVFRERVKVMDEALRAHLPRSQFTAPHGGYFFWARLPGVDTQKLREKAQAHQVGLRPGILFSSRNGLRDYMRLSVSFYKGGQIEEGILRLKNCIGE